MNPERSPQTYQSVELVPLLLEVVEGSAGGEVGPVVRLTLEAHVLQHPASRVLSRIFSRISGKIRNSNKKLGS